MSPVKKEESLAVALIEEQTSSNELSREKDMAYYLAKIKARAAQKSLELRYIKVFGISYSTTYKSLYTHLLIS